MSDYLSDEKVLQDFPQEFHQFIGNKDIRFLASGAVEIRISVPVVTEDSKEPTDLIVIHDITAGDLMAADAVVGEITKTAVTIGSAAGIPMASIKKMKGRDLMTLNRVHNAFLGIGQ